MDMTEKVVIALGGNAILQPGQAGTYAEQKSNVYRTCELISALVSDGHQLALVHGNGPQVGNIILQNELAGGSIPPMPLHILGAQSQGMIGSMILSGMRTALKKIGSDAHMAAVITQVEVDRTDEAFENPAKPIGMYYSEPDARQAMREKGETWREINGHGWRRVVASPTPIDIKEKGIIKSLVDDGIIVVSCGGGGIPVGKDADGNDEGLEAVIDKDLVAGRLAEEIGADALLILTDVSHAMLGFGTTEEVKLERVSVSDMQKYLMEGHFSKGSMEPKVKSCIHFVQRTGKRAIISSLERVRSALYGQSGTTVTV
jgi:carbamate kinase